MSVKRGNTNYTALQRSLLFTAADPSQTFQDIDHPTLLVTFRQCLKDALTGIRVEKDAIMVTVSLWEAIDMLQDLHNVCGIDVKRPAVSYWNLESTSNAIWMPNLDNVPQGEVVFTMLFKTTNPDVVAVLKSREIWDELQLQYLIEDITDVRIDSTGIAVDVVDMDGLVKLLDVRNLAGVLVSGFLPPFRAAF